jgi:phosphonate transport system substrate-binding protein
MCKSERGTGLRGRALALLQLLLVAFLVLTACGQQVTYPRVSLTSDPTSSGQDSQLPGADPLRVAVAAVLSPKETLVSYQSLLKYLRDGFGRPVELVQRQTYAETNDLIRSGEVDLAFVGSGAFVQGERDFGMELLVMPQVRGETTYNSYIIVPQDSPAQSLADLRGKVFAFTDPLSNSGRLVPIYVLLRMGEQPEKFFARTIYTYSHDNSIKAVAERLVDGAAVDSLVYEYTIAKNPRYLERTRIIYRSPNYGIPPVVVNPKLDSALKAQLRSLLLSLNENERGRAVLADLLIDRFLPPDPKAYDGIRELAAAVRR